ncbi:MAG: alkaline phosphatase [Myxococcota bacterium]
MEKKIPCLLVLCCLFTLSACNHTRLALPRAKNVVMVIVDGMGPEQVKAGRIYLGNQKLAFEKFPFQSTVTTHNIDGEVTDSAAAATAIATGQKVQNRVISPGKTLLEMFKEEGKSTGVATNTLLTDATPACFAGHAKTRQNTKDILNVYLTQTQPNLIAGADEMFYREQVKNSNASYRMTDSATGLEKIRREVSAGQKIDHVYAGFGQHPLIPGSYDRKTAMPMAATSDSFFIGQDIPKISDTAIAALDILNQNPKGFFLMIESGLVDWVGHKNKEIENPIGVLAAEMAETNNMVQLVADWAKAHPDTLVVVTADHETGGLKIDEKHTECVGNLECTAKGNWTSDLYPDLKEKFSKHTGVNVGVYAMGPGAEAFSKPMDNTEFVARILGK